MGDPDPRRLSDTLGAHVVQPGRVMLTLVQQDESLLAEVWTSTEEIGFVYPGQKVKLKFAAFSFQKYGLGEGVVEHVSADAADGFANNAANNAAPASDKTGRSTPLAIIGAKFAVRQAHRER